ncbi:TerB family tellurite resistance protein [Halomonas sp. TRM85114]|uniref:tellurite resistance TerB family protein n=1 Tax=Halomonas jincaotanensis TaxID=2810616 RepID=UPI001BD553F0|nr:TerB family tellurite resistance protein [Halomonas jincaotanensis]MBS9402464.1 TerB family tellurite resistance protein [Halomonas jincaotanensis]
MIDRIQRFFQQSLAQPGSESGSAPSLELATAALLCEVVRADYHIDDAELDTLHRLLKSHFGLADAQVTELMEMAHEEVDDAVDHYQFVSLIKENYDYEKRCELIEMMWSLALADGERHHLEEHRIRRLADLLHVGHADFIRGKLLAQGGQD